MQQHARYYDRFKMLDDMALLELQSLPGLAGVESVWLCADRSLIVEYARGQTITGEGIVTLALFYGVAPAEVVVEQDDSGHQAVVVYRSSSFASVESWREPTDAELQEIEQAEWDALADEHDGLQLQMGGVGWA